MCFSILKIQQKPGEDNFTDETTPSAGLENRHLNKVILKKKSILN